MKKQSVLLWHAAVSVVHQKVAVAFFLRSVHTVQGSLYYRDTDPAAPLFMAVARDVGIALHAVTGDPRECPPIFPATAAWIGSHEQRDPPWCAWLRTLDKPPSVILCLGAFSPAADAGVPRYHRLYRTGTPLRSLWGEGRPHLPL